MDRSRQSNFHAWLVVAVLWPVALLNYLDRQVFATMKSSMMAGLPDIATEQRFGTLMAVFLVVYGICSPLGGWLADRFDRRRAVIFSLAVWSLVTWLTGHCRTYEQLWWARAAMGVSEACYLPAALALIADFHTGATRSRAVGLHQSGIYAGLILGGLGGYVAESSAAGWRTAFDWLGLAGVLYVGVLYFFLRGRPRPEAGEEPGDAIRLWPALGQLLCLGSFLLLMLYFTLPALPGWMVKNWLPSILADTFKLGEGKAGISATLWVTLASFAGALLGGWLADRWMRRTPRGRIYTSALGTALCIPALFGAGLAPSLPVAIFFLVLFGLGYGFFDANNMPILCQVARPELRATGYGLMNLASITAGGWFTERIGAWRDGGAPHSLIFFIGALAAALAVAVVLFIRPQPELLPARPAPGAL